MNSGAMVLKINQLEVNWTEDSRRKEKPCVKCGKMTRGRAANGGGIKKPACVGCSIDLAFTQAKKVYGVKP